MIKASVCAEQLNMIQSGQNYDFKWDYAELTGTGTRVISYNKSI